MTAIVMNTANGAVSEYDWAFQSLTQDQAAGTPGLCALGGDDDAGAAITGEVLSGQPMAATIQRIGNVYVAVHGEGQGTLIVQGRSDSWEYPVAPRPSGVSSAKPGGGIREMALALGYRNVDGAAFRLDRIDADIIESKTRRK